MKTMKFNSSSRFLEWRDLIYYLGTRARQVNFRKTFHFLGITREYLSLVPCGCYFPLFPAIHHVLANFYPKTKKTFHSDSVSLPIPGQSSEMSINRQTGQCCCCCCCPGKCLGELPNYINFHPTTHELCHFFLSISLNWITLTSFSPFLIDRREWFWQIDTCPGIILFRSFKTAQYMIPYVLMVVLEFYLF